MTNKRKEGKKVLSLALTEEARIKLKKMADQLGISMAALTEIMIRERYKAEEKGNEINKHE